jgi:hypothetical protein
MIDYDLIKSCLQELSRREMQQELWLSSGPPGVSSFEEATCQLFNDSGLEDRLDKHEIVFSQDIDRRLSQLGSKLKAVDANRDPLSVINDPALAEIRQLANELLSELYAQ